MFDCVWINETLGSKGESRLVVTQTGLYRIAKMTQCNDLREAEVSVGMKRDLNSLSRN